jgi:hypothetical protein
MVFPVGVSQFATSHSTADPTSSTASAWRTAMAEAKGTQVDDFPCDSAENDDVVKTSFDYGKAVQTVITGNNYGPQANVTIDLSTNTATVTELDPTTGQKTQYHETIAESGPFPAPGNLPVDGGSAGGYAVDLPTSTASDQSIVIEDNFSKDGNILPGPSAVIDSPLAPGALIPTRRQLIGQRLLKVYQR